MSVKNWTDGDYVYGNDMDFLATSTVMRFASVAARDSTLVGDLAPVAGMLAYTSDDKMTWQYTGTAWARRWAATDPPGGAVYSSTGAVPAAQRTNGMVVYSTSDNRYWTWLATGTGYWVPSVGTVMCKAIMQNTFQSVPNATATQVINFDTYPLNINNCFANNRFTAPFPGTFALQGMVVYSGNATGYRSMWLCYNSPTAILAASGTQVTSVNYATMLIGPVAIWRMNAGDYIAVATYQTSGAALSLASSSQGADNQFMATYVGQGQF